MLKMRILKLSKLLGKDNINIKYRCFCLHLLHFLLLHFFILILRFTISLSVIACSWNRIFLCFRQNFCSCHIISFFFIFFTITFFFASICHLELRRNHKMLWFLLFHRKTQINEMKCFLFFLLCIFIIFNILASATVWSQSS